MLNASTRAHCHKSFHTTLPGSVLTAELIAREGREEERWRTQRHERAEADLAGTWLGSLSTSWMPSH